EGEMVPLGNRQELHQDELCSDQDGGNEPKSEGYSTHIGSTITQKGYEPNGDEATGLKFVAFFRDEHQWLSAERGATRDDHAAAVAQLLDERRRDMLRCGRHDDGIEGCLVFPPEVAVGLAHRDVVVAQGGEAIARGGGELRDDFDRIDVIDDLRQHGGL